MGGLQLQLKTYMFLKDLRAPIDWFQTADTLVDQVPGHFGQPGLKSKYDLNSLYLKYTIFLQTPGNVFLDPLLEIRNLKVLGWETKLRDSTLKKNFPQHLVLFALPGE